jgi:hypothetical protein
MGQYREGYSHITLKIIVMKKNNLVLWALALLALVMLVFAKSFKAGTVVGTVNPKNSATQVWIFSTTDTVKSGVQDGAFELSGIRAGTYNLVVDPAPPYKPASRVGIKVSDGEITNVGEIMMEMK